MTKEEAEKLVQDINKEMKTDFFIAIEMEDGSYFFAGTCCPVCLTANMVDWVRDNKLKHHIQELIEKHQMN